MSDSDTAALNSLKALDPERPIREADIDVKGIDDDARDLSDYLALYLDSHVAHMGA